MPWQKDNSLKFQIKWMSKLFFDFHKKIIKSILTPKCLKLCDGLNFLNFVRFIHFLIRNLAKEFISRRRHLF